MEADPEPDDVEELDVRLGWRGFAAGAGWALALAIPIVAVVGLALLTAVVVLLTFWLPYVGEDLSSAAASAGGDALWIVGPCSAAMLLVVGLAYRWAHRPGP